MLNIYGIFCVCKVLLYVEWSEAENTLDGTNGTQKNLKAVTFADFGHKMTVQNKVIFLLFHYNNNTTHCSYITKTTIYYIGWIMNAWKSYK